MILLMLLTTLTANALTVENHNTACMFKVLAYVERQGKTKIKEEILGVGTKTSKANEERFVTLWLNSKYHECLMSKIGDKEVKEQVESKKQPLQIDGRNKDITCTRDEQIILVAYAHFMGCMDAGLKKGVCSDKANKFIKKMFDK